MSYLYVIQAGDGPVKVGIAKDTERRLRTLATGNPAKLAVVARRAIENGDARKLEAVAHGILRDVRLAGEWFACTPERAMEAVERAGALSGARLGPPHVPRPPAAPITPKQCLVGREAFRWTNEELSRRAGVGVNTISRFEQGDSVKPSMVAKVAAVLVAGGLRFPDRTTIAGLPDPENAA